MGRRTTSDPALERPNPPITTRTTPATGHHPTPTRPTRARAAGADTSRPTTAQTARPSRTALRFGICLISTCQCQDYTRQPQAMTRTHDTRRLAARRARTPSCRSTSTTRPSGSRPPTAERRSPAGSASTRPSAEQLSRWALAHPDALRRRRPALLADRLADLARARRRAARDRSSASSGRSACSSRPRRGGGWELDPDASRWTRSARSPRSAPASTATCARPRCPSTRSRRCSSAGTRARCTPARARTLDAGQARSPTRSPANSASASRPGAPERPARPLGPRARAPPQPHHRRRHASAPSSRLRVVTLPGRRLPAPPARLGAASTSYHATHSAAMELGEAVQTAIDHGLPLLLSSRGRRASSRTPSASGA